MVILWQPNRPLNEIEPPCKLEWLDLPPEIRSIPTSLQKEKDTGREHSLSFFI